MANVAVVQGSSKGIGLAFARYLLARTSLDVVATTASASPSSARGIIDPHGRHADRLTTLSADATDERRVQAAAEEVGARFGRRLRFLVNVGGVLLKPEKGIAQLDYDHMKRTFEVNTFGHMLVYKHFLHLLPKKSTTPSSPPGSSDPARGAIPPGLSVLASMSARVGSIGDNGRGGWYSYRASKAAVNQVVKTLDLELKARSVGPAVAVALHPGTVAGTNLSEQVVSKEQRGSSPGVHGPEDAVEHLMKAIGGLTKDDGGRFIDWRGEDIPW